MQYLNNNCALNPSSMCQKSGSQLLTAQVFWIGKQIGPGFSPGTSPPKTKSIQAK